MKQFKTILAFQKHFDTDEKCREYLEQQRWNGTPACPHCGYLNVNRFATDNRIFKCREKQCRKKFSVTVGTIYENTKIPLTKWFLASYILTNHSKGTNTALITATFKAVFKFQDKLLFDEIPAFFYKNSIAIAFPYLRSFISTLTLQANIKPIILPLMNLSELEKPLKDNTTVIKD